VKKWIIIILVLVAGAGAVWYFFLRNPSPEDQASEGTWETGGLAAAGNFADADVINLGDGRYRLYYSLEPEVAGFNGQVYSALSTDGKEWVEEDGTRIEQATFPSVLELPDGRFRMYYQNAGTIKSAVSSDGLSWSKEPGTRIDIANPAGLSLTNVGAPTVEKIGEEYVMVYFGAINEKYTGAGLVPNNETHPLLWATSADGLTFEKKGIALDSRNGELKGWMDGPELVAWEGGEIRLYFWGYIGIYYSIFAAGEFGAPVLTFPAPNPDNSLFPAKPPADPTLVRIGETWFMYYGGHTEGIYYATLKD